MKPNVLIIAYTLIYTFAFREATKRTAEWGAFQFSAGNRWIKFWTSFIILGLLPLSFYWLSLRVISQLITNENSLVDLWIICQITLLGFFPFAAEHSWNLVAKCKVAKGTAAGQPGENWLLVKPSDLPHGTYSLEVLVGLGIVLGLFIYMFLLQQVSLDLIAALSEDLPQLFIMAYVSEMIVLHHRAKSLKYFYPETNPKHLLACRTIPSWFVSVLSPIIFAIFCYPWILWLQKANGWYFLFGLMLAVLFFFFPVYCNNALLVVAEKRQWITSGLELEGPKWLWILGAVSIVVFVLITWTNWNTYNDNRRDILKLTETAVKKLIEGNAPPERAREPIPPATNTPLEPES